MTGPTPALVDFFLICLMWVVMMVAMMVPGASPMIAAFAAINRRRREAGDPWVRTAVFLLGYLLVWSVFGAAAAGLQLTLDATGLLTPMMASSSTALSATLFAAAGLYQWTPLKEVCLRRCRSPIGFVRPNGGTGPPARSSWAFVTGSSAWVAASRSWDCCSPWR